MDENKYLMWFKYICCGLKCIFKVDKKCIYILVNNVFLMWLTNVYLMWIKMFI